MVTIKQKTTKQLKKELEELQTIRRKYRGPKEDLMREIKSIKAELRERSKTPEVDNL